jgi:hypothetical protein
MELVWPALGIAVIVCFVFFVLAQRWGRLLRHQTWMIQRLTDRVLSLEEMADPAWRRRLNDASPVPLEQVVHFSFNLTDRFWRDAIRISDEDRRFVQEAGSFVGSVKLERWRSHTVATIAEVLPDRKAEGWRTRSLDFYSGQAAGGESLSLWELPLARPRFAAERTPSLELLLRAQSIELRGHLLDVGGLYEFSGNGNGAAADSGDVVFFRVPLDSNGLAEFRSHDPADRAGNGNGGSDRHGNGHSWHGYYSFCDESAGIEWQLRLIDLTQKSEWEQWKILDGSAVSVPTRD